MKNRGCVFRSFWGAKIFPPQMLLGCLFTIILDQNSKKRHPKNHAKFDTEKVLKLIPKGYQTDANMEAKFKRFSNFFKKHEKYKIKPPLRREHGFTGSGYLKIHEKSIQKTYKIDARKSYAKVWKMMPKWCPHGTRNR